MVYWPVDAVLYNKNITMKPKLSETGFTTVELIIACVIFPIVVIGISNAFSGVQRSYMLARQLNEVYAVLSACPEIDRALEFSSLSSSSNCYPNTSFRAEGGSGLTNTYNPSMTVTDTSSLAASDPLRTIPDSKIININVGIPGRSSPPWQLRMLITRHGIGQL